MSGVQSTVRSLWRGLGKWWQSGRRKRIVQYREELPCDCPPIPAEPVVAPRVFFRLVSQYPPTERDFVSLWTEQPERRGRLDPCQSRGLSLFDTAMEARMRTSYNTLRGKIVRAVNLTPEAGPVLQTSAHHYTWWPLRDYDIIAQRMERAE